jgi:hypothetical protein
MKQFGLKPTLTKLSFGELNCIMLGTEGRGRKLTIVPMASNIGESDSVKIVPSTTGRPKIVKGDSPENGWIARIDTEGCYTRNTQGYASVMLPGLVNVIANGYGAYGDAGRIGNWDDMLLEIPDNTMIRVYPSGGESKRPSYYLWFGTEEVIQLSSEEFDLFCDSNDIAIGEFESIKLSVYA